jgi:nitrate reductase delta subunit
MLGFIKKSEAHAAALARVREWTRERFRLAADAPVVVAEIACPLPGCPPLETVVAFWSEGRRYQFKVFKPVADVAREDLPFTWLKPALAAADEAQSGCC